MTSPVLTVTCLSSDPVTAFQFPWASVAAVQALTVHWVEEKLFLETLCPCGVGGAGFSTFFWDGRVQDTGDVLVSQFGTALLSRLLWLLLFIYPLLRSER